MGNQHTLLDDRQKRIRQALQDGLQCLFSNVETLFQSLKKSRYRSTNFLNELESVYSFLETLTLIQSSMTEDRIQEVLRKSVQSLHFHFQNIPKADRSLIANIKIDPNTDSLEFLTKTYRLVGPSIRVSQNEMKAWITINEEDALFFNTESIIVNLKNVGIVAGIQTSRIESIFKQKQWSTEFCVAQGIPSKPGQDGRIKYLIDLEDLGLVPKKMKSGRVSFKDVSLYKYIATGEPIAQKIPPVPGKPGLTITNRTIKPLDPMEAEWPRIENTTLSEDKRFLLAAIDGCISKKNGQIVLKPTLRIPGNVSYKTGNLDSRVTVYVTNDIQSGFSVKTDKDLFVQGIIEGATIQTKGELVIQGGIQGKGKAVIEANGNISAKFISNATVNSLGSVSVENAITNCIVWSTGNVTLTGKNADILGGEIHSDGEIIANEIGSELGVKTKIILGERIKELHGLLEQTQNKINQQEDVQTKCLQIVDTLEFQSSQQTTSSTDIEQSLKRTHKMLEETEKNLANLNLEQDTLQVQYDEDIKRSRTIRARKTIHPGTSITINDISLDIKKPTGPVIVVKQNKELIMLPFSE